MENIIEVDNKTGIVTSAISGSAGGALLGSAFGIVGSIVGSILAASVAGYSTYKSNRGRVSSVKNLNIRKERKVFKGNRQGKPKRSS